MDRIEAMTVLVAVAETGSLSAAGRRLGQPLSTVSRKLFGLKAHLGAHPLLRGSRSVSLIHAGQGRLPLKLRAFLDFATPRLPAALRGLETPGTFRAKTLSDDPSAR
jgi:DNA-binding transcriptional LysR family regulator